MSSRAPEGEKRAAVTASVCSSATTGLDFDLDGESFRQSHNLTVRSMLDVASSHGRVGEKSTL